MPEAGDRFGFSSCFEDAERARASLGERTDKINRNYGDYCLNHRHFHPIWAVV
jgi:hypothetical protein